MTTEPIDLDAAQALADAATPGPWDTDGDYDRAEVCQTVEPFQTIVGTETTGRAYMSYEQLVLTAADSAFIAQARTLVPELVAELRRIRRGANTLGEILHRTNMDVLDAVGAHDLISEDGDGDWACVYELLAELRPDRDQWKARAEAAEAKLAALNGDG